MIEKTMMDKDADMMYTSRSPYLVQQMFARSKAYKVRDSAVTAVIPIAAEPKADTVKTDSTKVQAATPATETPAKESDSSKMWIFIIAGIAIIGGGMWFMRRK